MKKYIRIIIPVLIFVAAAAFILFLPDVSPSVDDDTPPQDVEYNCNEGIHNYTVENKCALCGNIWEYTEGLEFIIKGKKCGVSGIGIAVDDNIVIPYGYNGVYVTNIVDHAFSNCNYIKSVTLPDSIKIIQNFAFFGCFALKNINIPSNVTSIESSAFEACQSLESIDVPKNVVFGSNVFRGCINLKSINIPEGILHISDCMFENCINLNSVYIPKSVTQIDAMAFKNCPSLEKVVFEDPTGWKISGYAHEDDVFADPEKAAEVIRTEAWRYTWMKEE